MYGVMLDRASLDRGDLDFERLEGSLSGWSFYDHTDPNFVSERIVEAEVVVANKVILDAGIIARAPQLKLIAVAATGTNNVDLAAASERGITVCNIQHYATPSVVQHVFMLILNLIRHQPDYAARVAAGAWQRSDEFCLFDYPIRELGGLTLGIVGYGELGRAVSRAAMNGFGMRVVVAEHGSNAAANQEPPRLPLAELLGQVDIVTLHCPLTPQTRGLIGREELALMRPGAILINAARGGIVDELALADALRSGHLGGAGIDVLSQEPPTNGNPLLEAAIPNLIVTPHIAWASREARQRLVDQLVDNICAYISGQPRNVVNG